MLVFSSQETTRTFSSASFAAASFRPTTSRSAASNAAWAHRQWRHDLGDQLFEGLVEADDRELRVLGQRVELEDLL
ncbi:MAG: hypothetical protein GY913_28690, partial [Proteobacteria bacterium]|nr:hypothetical protein [Pseudomonadota bacterium]